MTQIFSLSTASLISGPNPWLTARQVKTNRTLIMALINDFAGVRRWRRLRALGMVPLLACVLLNKGVCSELPVAEEVFRRHVEAIGGAEALRRPTNLVFRGEVDMVSMKVKGALEFLINGPDRFFYHFKYHHAFFGKIRVPLVGKREVEWGSDGTNGWTVDMERNIDSLSAVNQTFLRSMLDKFSPLYFGRNFSQARTLDVEQFAGRDCYRVLLVFPSGRHAFEYYEVERGLLAGATYPFDTDEGTINIGMAYSDFRHSSKGLLLPFQMELKAGNQQFIFRAAEIRADAPGATVPGSKCKSISDSDVFLKSASVPANEIIEKYLQALGGRDAIQRHTSLRLTGLFEVAGPKGFSSPIEIFSAVTNRFYFKLRLPTGPHRQGCDGQNYWEANGEHFEFLTGKNLEQKLTQRQFAAELHEPEDFRSIETLGTLTLDGREDHQLLLIRRNGEVFDEFYDVKTGLLHARRYTDMAKGGFLTTLEMYANYRRFGDRLLPAHQTFKAPGVAPTLAISDAEWDKVPDTVFTLPKEAKAALLSKDSTGAK
jgi:hypothetical protein